MPVIPTSSFERCALRSGLIDQAALLEARRSLEVDAAFTEQSSNDDEHVRSVAPGASSDRAPLTSSEDEATPEKLAISPEALADRLVELGHLNSWQAMQLLAGRTKFKLGKYQIVDSIGQGGMGQVFKARHAVLGREVAVKVLPLAKASPKTIRGFTREIRALARLDHARLVAAIDAGHDGNVYYLVTEYVPGTDLFKWVRRQGPLGMTAAARIISDVADGLAHAHAEGVIHRDIKPGNVLVTPDGRAKLSDLGLAGSIGDAAEEDPRHGRVVGTPDYLAPDHVERPWEPTPLWDIYSLGGTLYYAVTGSVPFPGGTTAEKARAHQEYQPVDPRRFNPPLTDEFVDLMAQMMAKKPEDRVQSASEVVERLARWAATPKPDPDTPEPPPHPDELHPEPTEWLNHLPAWAVAIGLIFGVPLAAVLIVLSVWLFAKLF